MQVLRTPGKRFANIPDYPYSPHYTEINGLRIHHISSGEQTAEPVLLLHGEPSWSYLYRKMIPILTAGGLRAVAPDLVGFGKSDKPADTADYSYQRHVDWTWSWLQAQELEGITLVCQDWGSLIGLRLVAEHSELFKRVVVANGGLPTGDQEMPREFTVWQRYSQRSADLPIGRVVQKGTVSELSEVTLAAYEAPFPDASYKAGARIFPSLVPTTPDDPAAPANRAAWEALSQFEKPFLTAFSDGDPITARGDLWFRRYIPGTKGQPHTTVKDAGHFLQEDQGEVFANVILDFVRRNP
jgi:haloalkane dehalogenase